MDDAGIRGDLGLGERRERRAELDDAPRRLVPPHPVVDLMRQTRVGRQHDPKRLGDARAFEVALDENDAGAIALAERHREAGCERALAFALAGAHDADDARRAGAPLIEPMAEDAERGEELRRRVVEQRERPGAVRVEIGADDVDLRRSTRGLGTASDREDRRGHDRERGALHRLRLDVDPA